MMISDTGQLSLNGETNYIKTYFKENENENHSTSFFPYTLFQSILFCCNLRIFNDEDVYILKKI